METFTNESKSTEITDFTKFHKKWAISWKTANFMENATAMKS